MKSTTIVSQKGGVGKTTVALNLSYSLARSGLKTLLIDADPQGAVGFSLQGAKPSKGLVSLLDGGDPRAALLETRLPELQIMPVGEVPPTQTMDFSAALADGVTFTHLLSELAGDFEVAIIDTPSGFTGATLGALRASNTALSPLQAEPIALRTLPQLLNVIGQLRHEGSHVQLIGLILCMLQQRNASSLAVAEEVWSRLPADLVLDTTIPRDPEALAASTAGVPLALMSRLRPPPLSLVFDQLAAELVPKFGLEKEGSDEPLSLFA